jgi:hypothetical protein
MVSALLTKYLIVAFAAQITLAVINSLFILSSNDAMVVLIGFFGLLQRIPSVLLFFVVMQVLSIAMDVVRLVLWSPFILNDVMLVPGTLGTYFLVMTAMSTSVKIVVVIFTLLIRREIVEWLKDPRLSSTLTRQSGLSFLPDFLAPPKLGDTLLPPSTPGKQTPRKARRNDSGLGGGGGPLSANDDDIEPPPTGGGSPFVHSNPNSGSYQSFA